MAKITLNDSVIRHNGKDGINVEDNVGEVEIILNRSTIHDNAGNGIVVRPSVQEFLDVGINPSVSNEILLKAQEALGDVDPNDEKSVFARLSGIGFTEYLSVAANLVTVAQFILNLS